MFINVICGIFVLYRVKKRKQRGGLGVTAFGVIVLGHHLIWFSFQNNEKIKHGHIIVKESRIPFQTQLVVSWEAISIAVETIYFYLALTGFFVACCRFLDWLILVQDFLFWR